MIAMNTRHSLIAFAVIGLLGSQAASAHPSLPTDGSISDVAEKVVDSVVNISVQAQVEVDPFFGSFFGEDSYKQQGKGSGVIITQSGRILTNAHVVRNATDILVTLQDGTELDAKVIGTDPRADLAVLQLEGKFPTLKPIPWADSSALRLGEVVLAVGDGMGVGKSVSMGIVSAKGRGLRIADYEDFIQTDAAINPGNSGGALVNLKGELVGINTAIASRSGGYQGIGFAIPTNMAKPIMEALMKDGKVSRGFLGVDIATVNRAVVKELDLKATSGVLVLDVQKNGPGAKAGLAEGDVITSINGTAVKTSDALRNTIAMIKPGTAVELEVTHKNGKTATVKAKLGELPDADAQAQHAPARSKRQQVKPKMKKLPNGGQQWTWEYP
jgi:Do/DeqQ family serine protease